MSSQLFKSQKLFIPPFLIFRTLHNSQEKTEEGRSVFVFIDEINRQELVTKCDQAPLINRWWWKWNHKRPPWASINRANSFFFFFHASNSLFWLLALHISMGKPPIFSSTPKSKVNKTQKNHRKTLPTFSEKQSPCRCEVKQVMAASWNSKLINWITENSFKFPFGSERIESYCFFNRTEIIEWRRWMNE